MTASFYDGIVELYRTLSIQEANDLLKTGQWVPVKIAEVEAPVETAPGSIAPGLQWHRMVLYILGRREAAVFDASKAWAKGIEHEQKFPPPPPATSGPQSPSDRITDKQLDYIKALEKRSPAGAATVVKYLDDHRKKLLELTKEEAGDLIARLR